MNGNYILTGGGVDNAGCLPNYASVYLATSQDLKNFYYQGKVSYGNEFATEPDIEKFGDTYLMVTGWFENGIYWATSNDGRNFTPHKKLFGKSGQSYDQLYTTNPGIVRQGNRLLGIWYGAHTNVLTDAKIAAVYLQKEVVLETQSSTIKNAKALGPDNLILRLPSQEATGIFKIYDSDGTTLLFQSQPMTVRGGDVYRLEATPQIYMFYCKTANWQCVQTSSQYPPTQAGITQCQTNLGLYHPGQTTGICYTSAATCQSKCSPTPITLTSSLTPTPTLTPSQIKGDLNRDGKVDLLDFSIFCDIYLEHL